MSRRNLIAAIAVALLVFLAPRAAAEHERLPHLVLEGPRTLCIPDETPPRCRALPPGRFMDEPAYLKLDLELRRLQEQETRLSAENLELRKIAASWQPGWKTIALVLVVGLAGGAYGYYKFGPE